MFCSHCGNKIEENAKFCGHCGTPAEAAPGVSVQPELPGGIPAGFRQHSSGFYYKQEYLQDTVTGKMLEKVIWFNPFTGQYKEVTEDETARKRQRKNTAVLYVLMTVCGVAAGIVFLCFVQREAEPFLANVSKEQLMEEQESNYNLVNAFREYSKGSAIPIE